MPERKSHIKNITESHFIPEGEPMEEYAEGKVKVYGGTNPITVIDLPELRTHIIIPKFDVFELNKLGEISQVRVRKNHHKSEIAFGFTDRITGGSYGYDVWSPEGKIGFASGKRLDLYIASLFYADPRLNEQIKDAYMDDRVREYLDFAIVSAGYKKHHK